MAPMGLGYFVYSAKLRLQKISSRVGYVAQEGTLHHFMQSRDRAETPVGKRKTENGKRRHEDDRIVLYRISSLYYAGKRGTSSLEYRKYPYKVTRESSSPIPCYLNQRS